MVSTRPLISNSSSPCINLLVTVLSTAITIGITITFMFYSFCSYYCCGKTKQSGLSRQCLRNSPMLRVLFGHVTRWTKESNSFTNRTLSWADIMVHSSRSAHRGLPPLHSRVSGFHHFAVWTFLFVLWMLVTVV